MVQAGGTITPAVGTCYELHFDASSADSTFTIDASGATNVAIFTEHVPTEFERDTHYLRGASGVDVEPAAEAAAASRHDHGDGTASDVGLTFSMFGDTTCTATGGCAFLPHGACVAGTSSPFLDDSAFYSASCGADGSAVLTQYSDAICSLATFSTVGALCQGVSQCPIPANTCVAVGADPANGQSYTSSVTLSCGTASPPPAAAPTAAGGCADATDLGFGGSLAAIGVVTQTCPVLQAAWAAAGQPMSFFCAYDIATWAGEVSATWTAPSAGITSFAHLCPGTCGVCGGGGTASPAQVAMS